jgi:hypothetical protein
MRGVMVSDSGNELVCNGMFNLLIHYFMVDLSMASLEVDSPRQEALRFWKDLNTSRLLTHCLTHTLTHILIRILVPLCFSFDSLL